MWAAWPMSASIPAWSSQGQTGPQLHQGQARAHRTSDPHARRSPRRYDRSPWQAISAPFSVSRNASPAIPCATRKTSCWKTSPSRSRSSPLPSSPRATADQEKMGEALRKLSEEDPTFRVARTKIPGRPLSRGWASFISTFSLTAWLREFKVQANVGSAAGCLSRIDHPPVTRSRITSMPSNRADAVNMVMWSSPWSRVSVGQGIVFENKIIGGSIPKEFIPPIEKGFRKPRKGCVGWLSSHRHESYACLMGPSMRSIRTKWLSSWPPSWASRKVSSAALRFCSSRS